MIRVMMLMMLLLLMMMMTMMMMMMMMMMMTTPLFPLQVSNQRNGNLLKRFVCCFPDRCRPHINSLKDPARQKLVPPSRW